MVTVVGSLLFVIRSALLCKGVKTPMMQWCFIQRMQGLPWKACQRRGKILISIHDVPNKNGGMHPPLVTHYQIISSEVS